MTPALDLDVACVNRAVAAGGVAAVSPGVDVFVGWYKADEQLPQIGLELLEPGELAVSHEAIPSVVEGTVQATIVARTLAEASTIATALEADLSQPWTVSGHAFSALRVRRFPQPGQHVQTYIVDFEVTREKL